MANSRAVGVEDTHTNILAPYLAASVELRDRGNERRRQFLWQGTAATELAFGYHRRMCADLNPLRARMTDARDALLAEFARSQAQAAEALGKPYPSAADCFYYTGVAREARRIAHEGSKIIGIASRALLMSSEACAAAAATASVDASTRRLTLDALGRMREDRPDTDVACHSRRAPRHSMLHASRVRDAYYLELGAVQSSATAQLRRALRRMRILGGVQWRRAPDPDAQHAAAASAAVGRDGRACLEAIRVVSQRARRHRDYLVQTSSRTTQTIYLGQLLAVVAYVRDAHAYCARAVASGERSHLAACALEVVARAATAGRVAASTACLAPSFLVAAPLADALPGHVAGLGISGADDYVSELVLVALANQPPSGLVLDGLATDGLATGGQEACDISDVLHSIPLASAFGLFPEYYAVTSARQPGIPEFTPGSVLRELLTLTYERALDVAAAACVKVAEDGATRSRG